jgi:hypothetical protein
MGSTCPGCGAAAEFSPAAVRAVHGTCSACGGTFTIVEPGGIAGEPGPSTAPGETRTASGPGLGGTAPTIREAPLPGPPCRQCGTPLVLRSWTAEFAKAACLSCGSTVDYRTMPLARGPGGRRPDEFGGPRETRSFPPQRGKPCRECGGPLSFSTDAAGVVTGECPNCGNRFTLPPRSRPAREGRMGGPPRFSRGYSPRFQRPRDRFGPGGDRPASRGPPRRSFRSRERGEDDEERGPPPRRRRRPREE